MPGKQIVGSSNIAFFDTKITPDLCLGRFFIDITPSVFLGTGANNVSGCRIQITNPYGVIIKPYGVFDILPPMTGVFQYNIPTQAGVYQFGKYEVAVEITYEVGKTSTVIKSFDLCGYPDNTNPGHNCIKLKADCKNGRLSVDVTEPPVYKGKTAVNKTQFWKVDYPTGTGIASENTTVGNFSLRLFEGVYKISGNVCAEYDLGDNINVKVGYKAEADKNVKCLIDESCIYPKLRQLHDTLVSNCSLKEKETASEVISSALFLLRTIDAGKYVGEDVSGFILELEDLLQINCTCGDALYSPIINNTPSKDYTIQGCGVTKTTVGLTDVYTIDNFDYVLDLDDGTNSISLSAVTINGCTKTQRLSFNIGNVYSAIKSQINTQTEYDFFASVLNKSWDNIDPTCLGLTTQQWATMSFFARSNALFIQSCSGGACDAQVLTIATSKVGSGIKVDWTVNAGTRYVKVYVNGDFVDTKMFTISSMILEGYANGLDNTVSLVPVCENGLYGAQLSRVFNELGCPQIAPLNVSSNNITNANCPYDLTGLVTSLPAGITAEWHIQNNTLSSSLLGNPASVGQGVYYVFGKNGSGCYSEGVQVAVVCAVSGSVTAPQNLQAIPVPAQGLKVSFESAQFPPLNNSYTLRRRLFSDPDIAGSYATLGSVGSGIVFNPSTGKYELQDTTAAENTLYVYRAVSNGGSNPFIDYTYANIICQNLTIAKTQTQITASFNNIGGQVDKYVVSLYAANNPVALASVTLLPVFTSTLDAVFPGLSAGNYQVEKKAYIGSYVKSCGTVNVAISQNSISGQSIYSTSLGLNGAGSITVNDPAGAQLTVSVFGGACGSGRLTLNVTGVVTNQVVDVAIPSSVPFATKNVQVFIPFGTHAYTVAFANATCPSSPQPSGSISI